MNDNYRLADDLLKEISGGVLPKGWKTTADLMAPSLIKEYAGITYAEACLKIDELLVGNYGIDANDGVLIKDYLKKYFDENGNMLPQYLQ